LVDLVASTARLGDDTLELVDLRLGTAERSKLPTMLEDGEGEIN